MSQGKGHVTKWALEGFTRYFTCNCYIKGEKPRDPKVVCHFFSGRGAPCTPLENRLRLQEGVGIFVASTEFCCR